MSGYFLAGNLWLLLALAMKLGAKVARTQPTMVSFFGIGAWFYPLQYNLLVILALLLGCVFLGMDRRAARR